MKRSVAILLAAALLAIPAGSADARHGLDGRYAGKITGFGQPPTRTIVLRVNGHRVRLVRLPLEFRRCRIGTDPPRTVRQTLRRGSARIKHFAGGHLFNLRRRIEDFKGTPGTMVLHIGVSFHGDRMRGSMDARLEFGSGNCSDGGFFNATRN
ncbi:MAG TPA: hypothetical protein VJS87_01140 [Solirubrobacterales bacterium]|nr:hypothetical protein [Solirubrobacterales bacterium]